MSYGFSVRWAVMGAAVAAIALTSGCAPSVQTHGHRLDEAAIAQIQPGRTTRDEVARLLGSPSSLATFDDSSWYYVSQRTEVLSFYQSDVVQQDVVTISFDPQGVVSAIDRRGLDDARTVRIVQRETPTTGTEMSMLEQFVGNLGRFNLPRDTSPAPTTMP
jgi:outer membrane protein assembly factor BamE (lipoprotein component of BamABCDE complex)